jgi:hypothetical protein
MRLARPNGWLRDASGFYHFPYRTIGAILVGTSIAGLLYPFQSEFRWMRYLLVAFVILGLLITFLEHRRYRKQIRASQEILALQGGSERER